MVGLSHTQISEGEEYERNFQKRQHSKNEPGERGWDEKFRD